MSALQWSGLQHDSLATDSGYALHTTMANGSVPVIDLPSQISHYPYQRSAGSKTAQSLALDHGVDLTRGQALKRRTRDSHESDAVFRVG
jgi:hypothetical protein